MIRCYITDRSALGGSIPRVLGCIDRAIACGVDLVQIREKDLSARALLDLTARAVSLAAGTHTRILVNDRLDVALAARAHGVHLPSGSPPPAVWRQITPPGFLIGVSCHTPDDIRAAEGADYVVYGPVFPSPGKGAPIGLDGLARGVEAASMPVLALGGVDEGNAAECLARGASGIAAIRLFQREG